MFRGWGSIQACPGSWDCHQPQNRSWTWISGNFPGASVETQSRCKTSLAFGHMTDGGKCLSVPADEWSYAKRVSRRRPSWGAASLLDNCCVRMMKVCKNTGERDWIVVCTIVHRNQRYFVSLLVHVYINGLFAALCSQTKYIWLYLIHAFVFKTLNTLATTLQSALTKLI